MVLLHVSADIYSINLVIKKKVSSVQTGALCNFSHKTVPKTQQVISTVWFHNSIPPKLMYQFFLVHGTPVYTVTVSIRVTLQKVTPITWY